MAAVLSFGLVESPAWMASVGAGDHAAKTMEYIARFNGKEPLGERFLMANDFEGN